MMDEIRKATIERCIDAQDRARLHAELAQYCLSHSDPQLFNRARLHQEHVRYYHGQAYMRLARLIGVA